VKWLAIANPAAGRLREADRMLELLRGLHDVDAEIARTAAPGDATRLARAASAYDGVIAVGGDGTIMEVLQGLDLRRQHLAVLPAGHGNCLARDLGAGDADDALDALRRGASRPLDLMEVDIGFADGRADRRLCASTLAIGYVTDVVMFGRHRLPALGRVAYAAAAMVVVPQKFEATVAGNGSPEGRRQYTGIVINNTVHLANFRGFPDASVRDGLVDVMEQGYGWPRQLLHNLSVLAGSRTFGPLEIRQAPTETLQLHEARTLMADGELLHGVSRVAVECRPAAVMCVAGTEG
jgi:diacylglycerol kinase (ATP)